MPSEFIPARSFVRTSQRGAAHPSAPNRESISPSTLNDEDYRLHRRFDRMGRLIGDRGMQTLRHRHVMVIGLGGVGSWAAESFVRSGIGHITLVDFDLVCITNTNRQLHAMKGSTGKAKVEVMGQRLQAIHPHCQIRCEKTFYNAESSDSLLRQKPDLVVDAIDNIQAKAHLIASCQTRGIPLVVSGGASGRMDPTKIREHDLSEVTGDPFLAAVRKVLRKRHGFPHQGPWNIATIHSLEAISNPLDLTYDNGQGFRCVCPQGNNGLHSCDQRNVIYGTASFVTGSFGLACTATAIRMLLNHPPA